MASSKVYRRFVKEAPSYSLVTNNWTERPSQFWTTYIVMNAADLLFCEVTLDLQ
jgi:hypothetical protein